MQARFVNIEGDLRGYLALPQTVPAPAVLVYMEAFGVNAYVESECRRLAEQGYVALAPDFYRGETFAYGDFPAVRAKMQQLSQDALSADRRAAVAYLDGLAEAKHGAYGVVGFCMGGRLAFLTAAEFGARIAAAVSFYGGGIAPDEPGLAPSILHRAPDIHAPLMLFYGAQDTHITPSEHARIAAELSTHKKAYTLSVYPHAGHGFASSDRDSYNPQAAQDAWAHTLLFFETHLQR
ncbi:MAG TPA: dienelactone hydrolase family protein [Candidatus Acidoferrales bacterium]|nr:dienelactone hydrolase family protein [Candidatus Acidoferrales bacterium]